MTVRGMVSRITYEGEGGFQIARIKVLEGSIDPSAGPALVAAGAAALAAASGSSKGSGRPNSKASRSRQQSQQALLAVKGTGLGLRPGAEVALRGSWEQHDTYGWQMTAHSCTELPPSDTEAYLVGCLPGVGPKTAALLVAGLGRDHVREALSSSAAVSLMQGIRGIGARKAAEIKQAWDKNTGTIESFAWLQQHQLPASCAQNIASTFGSEARERAAADPYSFISSVPGFKLAHAETLAASLGFDPGAPQRSAAVMQHVLMSAAQTESAEGLTWRQLQQRSTAKLAELNRVYGRPWPAGFSLREGGELLVADGRAVAEEVSRVVAALRPHNSSSSSSSSVVVQAAGVEDGGRDAQQQQQYEFELVSSGWSDDALFKLSKLHAAESDVIDFILNVAAACSASMAGLWHKAGSSSSSSSVGRRSRLSSRSTTGSTTPTSSSSSSTSNPPLQLLPPITPDIQQRIAAFEAELSADRGSEVCLNEGQRQALALALSLPAVVLTGGPGCGKTLTSQAVARSWLADDEQLHMAAPTGRAAQRLQEVVSSCGYDANAATIHRLLGYKGRKTQASAAATAAAAAATSQLANSLIGSAAARKADDVAGGDYELDLGRACEFGKAKKLPASKLLVDECSMMDLPLAAALLNAIERQRTSLLLVGDPDQLPPVGPGRPFAAALAAGLLPCIDLRQIYRSAAGSAIVKAAHAINQGQPPAVTTWDLSPWDPAADLAARLAATPTDPATGQPLLPSDALFVRLPEHVAAEAVADVLLGAVAQLSRTCSAADVQVLSPTKRNACGTAQLNSHLQQLLNPPGPHKQELPAHSSSRHRSSSQQQHTHGPVWRVGDRVVHLVNDTERDVYNGDLGVVLSVDAAEGSLIVRYPPRGGSEGVAHQVRYQGAEIGEQLQLAWAITVHKAQGGEFPIVLMPLERSAGRFLLRRPLLYTAVSRAKRLLILIGTQGAMDACIQNTASHGAVAAAGAPGSGWLAEMQSNRMVHKLRAAAAAQGLKLFPRMMFGPQGWHVQQ